MLHYGVMSESRLFNAKQRMF